MKWELQRELTRASPAMSFEAACNEALALERENARDDTVACQARAVLPALAPPPSALDIEQLKDSLWTELRQEIKEQVTLLGKTIIEEIRNQVSAPVGRTRTPYM